jgi:hypothetical protein
MKKFVAGFVVGVLSSLGLLWIIELAVELDEDDWG